MMVEGRSTRLGRGIAVERAATGAWGGWSLLRIAQGTRGLTGWRRRGLAMLLGAIAGLALPPLHAIPLLLPAFTGLVWLVDGTRRPANAFAAGWWFGFGHFAVGSYWIANALLTDAARFGWMIPPVVGGLAAVLAVFPGLACAAVRLVPGVVARIVALAGAWTVFEWLRGWIFSGYPWNLIGYSWAFSDAPIQFAAFAGIWGLSLVTVYAAAVPAALAPLPGPRVRRWAASPAAAVGAAVLVIAAIWLGGLVRLEGAADATVPGVRLRLVQADIDQHVKWAAGLRDEHLRQHLQLTLDTPGFDKVTHVIWSESAMEFLLEREPRLRRVLAQAVPPGGVLITGAVRAYPEQGDIERVWNSLVAIDGVGAIVGTFDKFHLVPLGEYVPLRRYLPFLSKITPGALDFTAGPGPRTLRLPGLPPVSPLICYEVIFPGHVLDPHDRPDWILNLTNDGWFGTSTGPYQHFASARVRAVEEGLPLVRAANTGISGVVDAYGRIVARLGLGQRGVLDAALPRPAPQSTLYARFGDWTLAVMLALVGCVVGVLRRFG